MSETKKAPRGRPRSVYPTVCQNPKCSNPATRYQSYCSKECSPLGGYGLYTDTGKILKPPKPPPMDPYRRELMFKVINDDMRVVQIVYQIDQFKYCDVILKWLVDNHMTGRNLMAWLNDHHDRSVLSLVTEIVRRVEKNAKRALLASDLKEP